MLGIVGIAALLTVLTLSLIITRLATVALTITGLSPEAARFQARSAFTGSGFTTSESEVVTNHPVRRRIVLLLMTARSAGLVSIIISLILSFGTGDEAGVKLWRLAGLTGGASLLWLISRSSWIDNRLNRAVTWALKRFTELDVRDYVSLLDLRGEYTIRELHLSQGDWMVGKRLAECNLSDEGVLVLGIYRSNGDYVGAPRESTEIYADDTLLLYGRGETLTDLHHRQEGASGDASHRRSVDRQREKESAQEEREKKLKRERGRG